MRSRLACPRNSVADLAAYEYYTPLGWLKGLPFLAVQVVWAPGSEILAWNDYLKKFVMLYTNTLNNVVMRTAAKPEGPWSSAKTIVTSAAVPGGIYAPTSIRGRRAAICTSRCRCGPTTASC
jgi:hypothetical protein